MNKRLVAVFGCLLSVGLIVIVGLLLAPKPPFSTEIRRQLSFALYLPQLRDVAIERDSAKFSQELKLLTFTSTGLGGQLTFSEQPAPDTFTDIPDYYTKVVAAMGEYKSFDVPVGTVHLTRPPELKGKQAAVITSGGTLMFVKPTKDLSDDEWRKLFKSVILTK